MEKDLEENKTTTASAIQEAKSLFYIIFIALTIRILIFEPFFIPSGSMRMNLIEGDYVFSTKYDYGYSKHSFVITADLFSGRILDTEPERGDIVIFRPPHLMETRFIKRLIGLPGDKVQFVNGDIFINNKKIERKLVRSYQENDIWFNEYEEILPNGKSYKVRMYDIDKLSDDNHNAIYRVNNLGPYIVPEDHYFFLGDNRHESGDSRFSLGYVPFENFISKARFVFFSFGENLFTDNILSINQLIQIPKWIFSFKFSRFLRSIDG